MKTPNTHAEAPLRRVTAAALLALTACGGGGGGSSEPPPPPPPDPTVNSMAVNPAAFGTDELIVTITGTNLAQGMSVTSAQCTTLTLSNSPDASTASTAYYRCANQATAGTAVDVKAGRTRDGVELATASFAVGATTVVTTALAGEGGTPPDENGLALPGIAKYGQRMVITVTGTHVNQGLHFPATPACTDIAPSVTPPFVSSSTVAYYRCRVAAVDLNQVSIEYATAPGTDAVAPPRFNVPAPKVRLAMSQIDPANSNKTPLGTIQITLKPLDAPIAVNNFLDYVNSGFYNGTIFHNVQASTSVLPLITGGRFPPTTGSPMAPQKTASAAKPPEPGTSSSFLKGTVAMTLNTTPDSGPAQFFINTANNGVINGATAVIGWVHDGLLNVDTIATSCQGLTVCLPVPNFTIDAAEQVE